MEWMGVDRKGKAVADRNGRERSRRDRNGAERL
jgi:hypothetical protein